jgi:hypothetical protein
MIGRERRERMFVERPANFGDRDHNCDHDRSGGGNLSRDDGDGDVGGDDDDWYACMSVSGLRRKLHEFFRRLKRSPYLLAVSLPTFNNNGNVLRGDKDDVASLRGGGMWRLKSEDNVQHAFARAEEFFLERCCLANAASAG